MNDRMTHLRNMTTSRRDFLKGSAAVMAGALLPLAGRARLTASMVIAQPAGNVIDVTDPQFGAAGDGVTDDRAAFQAAINAAIKQKLPLWVPPPSDFYRIVLTGQDKALMVTGHVEIVGGGRTTTLLRFSIIDPDTSARYAGFNVANGRRFRVSDLRLEEDVKARDFDFAGFDFPSGDRNHAVIIERVDVDGFSHVVFSGSSGSGEGKGELFITIRSCDFKPDWRYCVGLWTVPYGHKRLHIYDSYFHDNKDSHLVYSHPHNSVHVENCRFDGATSWAFQFQGSEVAGDPEYQRFIGCWFGPRNSRGIITQLRTTVKPLVEVRNCVFQGRPAIQIRSDIIIDGCYFTTPADPLPGTNFVGAYDEAPWKAVISNCIFALRTGANPAVDLRLAEGIDVTMENCQFYAQTSTTMVALGNGGRNVFDIANCLFYTRAGDGNASKVFDINDGQTTIRRCRFVGPITSDRGLFNLYTTESSPGPEARLQIDDCLFNALSGGSLFYVLEQPAAWSERIFGSNNRITNLISDKAMLRTEPGGVPVYGFLNPVSAAAPAPLTAAPTLVITSNYDEYEVLGAADVLDIHWWQADGQSDQIFSGVITLIAGTGFTLVTGGNIDLGGASSLAVAARDDIRLFYDPTQATWTVVGG